MNNKTDILIAGGDMRQLFCAERLADRFAVAVTGFDDELVPDVIPTADSGRKYGCHHAFPAVSAQRERQECCKKGQ